MARARAREIGKHGNLLFRHLERDKGELNFPTQPRSFFSPPSPPLPPYSARFCTAAICIFSSELRDEYPATRACDDVSLYVPYRRRETEKIIIEYSKKFEETQSN